MRVLVVDDEPSALRLHVHELRTRGLAVDGRRTVRAASAACREVPYDALVVRRKLVDGDGMTVVGLVEAPVAVVVVAATDTTKERLELLGLGIDDCISPPVDVEELALRLCKALARRAGSPARVRIGPVVLDRARREVTVGDDALELTPRQMCVLEHLIVHRHRVVGSEELLVHCWDDRVDPFSNPVPSQITRLRSKLAGALDIAWTGGFGYLVREPNAR